MTARLVHASQGMPNVVEWRRAREMTADTLACKRRMSAPFPHVFACTNRVTAVLDMPDVIRYTKHARRPPDVCDVLLRVRG
jgi:hypothetical protein